MKHKKAQTAIIAFMIAIVIILLGLAFMGSVNLMTTDAMNSTSEIGGMNCTATTNDFAKVACYAIDLNQLLFLGGLIALAGVIIAAKIIFQ